MARFVLLGTAQDGGVPQIGCGCPRCARAVREPALRRTGPSAAVILADGRAFLLDASPDLRLQQAERGFTVAGVFLTHAHMGHYTGLLQLGREAMGGRGIEVFATPSMCAFLSANRPFAHLIARGDVAIDPMEPGDFRGVGEGILVTSFAVPHRGEDTDTVGYEVRGPARTVTYVPDLDILPDEIVERAARADAAFLDGTFFSDDELPPERMAEVPHPRIRATAPVLAAAGAHVHYTHLNHTNPLVLPDAPERAWLGGLGLAVAEEGQTVEL
jgi:pyrroloquinoline quinone biosynthesis protein B